MHPLVAKLHLSHHSVSLSSINRRWASNFNHQACCVPRTNSWINFIGDHDDQQRWKLCPENRKFDFFSGAKRINMKKPRKLKGKLPKFDSILIILVVKTQNMAMNADPHIRVDTLKVMLMEFHIRDMEAPTWPEQITVSKKILKNPSTLVFSIQCSVLVFFIIVTITGHEQIQEWRKQVWNVNSKASVQGWQQSASLSQSELAWFNRHHWQNDVMWIRAGITRIKANYSKHCAVSDRVQKSNQELLNTGFQRPVLCSCIFIIVTITGHEQIQEWRKQVWNVNSKASVQGWQQSASLSQSELAWFNRHHWQNDVMWIRAGITRIKANYSKHCAVSDRVQKSNQELLNTGFQRPVLCSCIFIIVTITGHEQIQEWRKQVWNVNSKASVQGWQQSGRHCLNRN